MRRVVALLLLALTGCEAADAAVLEPLVPRARGRELEPGRARGDSLDTRAGAPLFSFAAPTGYRGYGTSYPGLPASDGCYAAASVTGTKGEALTFTRATTRFCPTDGTTSEATGVMCASGEVCITSLSGKRGISIFRAGTNLNLRSEAFENASYTLDTGVTVSANDAACPVAPDGTQTMDLITFAGANGTGIKQAVTVSAGAVTRSLWVAQKTGGAACSLGLTDSTEALAVTTVTAASGRVRWANTSTEVGTTGGIYLKEVTAGDCADVCVWGGMTQNSAYATPYVATAGASATRNAESASFSAPATGATFCASVAYTPPSSVVTGLRPFTLYVDASNKADLYNNGGFLRIESDVTGAGTRVKQHSVALGTSPQRVGWYGNGTTIGVCSAGTCEENTSVTAPSNVADYTTLHLGTYLGGTTWADGLLSDFQMDSSPTRCARANP